jgi:hypothetical protein
VSRVPYPDFLIRQRDRAVDLGLQRLGSRFTFADELPHLVSVSRAV